MRGHRRRFVPPDDVGLWCSGGLPGHGTQCLWVWALFLEGGRVRDAGVPLSRGIPGAMDLVLSLFDNRIGRKRNVDGGVLADVGWCAGMDRCRDKTLTVTL